MNRNPAFIPLVLAFKIQDNSIYPASMFTQAVMGAFSASKQWHIMEKKAEKSTRITVEFCQLIRGLHSAPSSSASLERIFSTFGHVWSKQRNRLGPDKAEKLVKAYRYLRCDNEPEPDW